MRAVGLPENAIPTALLFFNLGVELGSSPSSAWCWRSCITSIFATVRAGVELAPAAYGIGAVAMYWTIERVSSFWS